MKRTTTRRRRELKTFLADNRRLFPFWGMFLLGAAIGGAAFVTARDRFEGLTALLELPAPQTTFLGWLSAWGSRGFALAAPLAVLFLLGMWACSAPFIPLVPLLYGMGLGLTEAYYYGKGPDGVLTVAAVLLPGALLGGAVLITAAAESLQLSLCLSRQLLPETGEAEGLWSRFRLYGLRYLLFFAAAAVCGALEALLRILAGGWIA